MTQPPLVKIPARGVARELVLAVGGVIILVIVAVRGQVDATAAVAIALALLGVGPGATVGSSIAAQLHAGDGVQGKVDEPPKGDPWHRDDTAAKK